MMEWLLLFVVHSSLWCGLAWLWMRLRPNTHARVRETIWYTALAASLITPTAQAFTPSESAFWHLPLPAAWVATSEAGHLEGGEASHDATSTALSIRAAGFAWLAIATALVLVYLGRLEALRRRLGRRETTTDERASLALDQLSKRAGLRRPPLLTESDELGSPIALGVGSRREICLPSRALHELDEEELSAMLGHEIAHHLRRDTVRLAILNTLQAVFFFQPLFLLAGRHLHLAVEEQCDDWAARQLDDRMAMASCLTEVAAWVVRQDRRMPTPCMARRKSPLRARVDRLMDEHGGLQAPAMAWRGVSSVGFLVTASWLAPAIGASDERSHSDQTGPRYESRHDSEHAGEGHFEDRHSRGEHDND